MWNSNQFCMKMKGLHLIVFAVNIYYIFGAAVIEETTLPANSVSSLSMMNSFSNVCELVKKGETNLCACKKENASILNNI